MKKPYLILPTLLTFASTLALHADTFLYEGGDNNWQSANWYNATTATANQLPGAAATDAFNFGTWYSSGTPGVLTLNTAESIASLGADRGTRTLNVEAGGSLTTTGNFTMNNWANAAFTLTTNINGGSVTLGTLAANSGSFSVQSNAAGDQTIFNLNSGSFTLNRGLTIGGGSGGTSQVNISNGTFNQANAAFATNVGTGGELNISGGSVTLGSSVTMNGGKFSLTGDAAGSSLNVGSFGYNGLSVTNSASELNYIFDSTGVTALDMGRLQFDAATTLNLSVNADALSAATVGQQILLMNYAEWRLGGVDQGNASILPQIVFNNTGSTVTGTLVNDTTAEALYFEVTATSPGVVVPVGVDVAIVGADVQCTFDSVNGQSYQLLVSTDDMASFAPVAGASDTGDGNPLTLTDTGGAPASGSKVFYKVDTN